VISFPVREIYPAAFWAGRLPLKAVRAVVSVSKYFGPPPKLTREAEKAFFR